MKERAGEEAEGHGLVNGHHNDTEISGWTLWKQSKSVGRSSGMLSVSVICSNSIRHCQRKNIQITPKITSIIICWVVHDICYFNIRCVATIYEKKLDQPLQFTEKSEILTVLFIPKRGKNIDLPGRSYQH